MACSSYALQATGACNAGCKAITATRDPVRGQDGDVVAYFGAFFSVTHHASSLTQLASISAPAPYPRSVATIWESGTADLRSLVRRRGLVPPAQFSESELTVFDPCRKLARGTRPLLVIHGEADNLIHPAEAKIAFAAAAASDKTLCLIPDHGHNDLAGSSLYWKSIREFVHRVTPI